MGGRLSSENKEDDVVVSEPTKQYSREEVIKALVVSVTTDDKGEDVVKSELLDMLTGPKRTAGTEFSWTSIYDPKDEFRDESMAKALEEHKDDFSEGRLREDRSFGAMFGMAVGDAMGARLEFKPLDYEAHDVTGMGTERDGKFLLQPGQWTDDTSMGLCVADSLLVKGKFDGHDMMHRFLAWWYCGLNNTGRFEEEGPGAFQERRTHTSCGLGRLMRMSFESYLEKPAVATSCGTPDSSGNGSIMRLAAVPVFYRQDIEKAEEVARLQSLITHQGIEAAECCRLMAHIMVRGINGEQLHDVLDSLATSFKTDCPGVMALAQSRAEKKEPKPSKTADESSKKEEKEEAQSSSEPTEEEDDPDRNWNWKAADFKYSPTRAGLSSGYIGSYAMDGFAMALHILYTTKTFSEAVLKAVNLRGDADTVAAISGQIAGSFYGCSQIPTEWKKTVMQWDGHEIALRAYRLYNHFLLNQEEKAESQ